VYNRKIKPIGTVIGEFEFLVLAISFLKCRVPYLPIGLFSALGDTVKVSGQES